jgi:hypothetical protein
MTLPGVLKRDATGSQKLANLFEARQFVVNQADNLSVLHANSQSTMAGQALSVPLSTFLPLYHAVVIR